MIGGGRTKSPFGGWAFIVPTAALINKELFLKIPFLMTGLYSVVLRYCHLMLAGAPGIGPLQSRMVQLKKKRAGDAIFWHEIFCCFGEDLLWLAATTKFNVKDYYQIACVEIV